MKELLGCIRRLDWKGLMITPSDNLFIQLFRYAFVGGLAFVADFGTLALLYHKFGVNEYLATAIAFVMGLIVNFILSKLLVFTTGAKVKSTVLEFLSYTVIGIIGLGLTEAIIWLGTVPLHFPVLVAKVIAAGLVLIWNFAARKIFLYGGKA